MEKFYICLCCIALMVAGIQAAAVPAEFVEPGKAAHEKCVKQTGMDDDTYGKLAKYNFEVDDKCYFKCIFEEFGLIENDAINFETMLAITPEAMKEGGTRVVQNCRSSPGKNACEQSYNVIKCFYKEDPEEFFII